jgi:GGDEF domain-containing protein
MGSLTTNTLANQGAPSPADYVHFIRVLLDGVSQHVIPGDGRDLKQFRSDISTLSGSLSERSSSAEISSLLDSGLRSLATYNTRTAKLVMPPTAAPVSKFSEFSDRPAAEQAIATKIAEAKDCVCGVFIVNRLASINARFGRAVGNEVMLLAAERLGQYLPAGAAVFRWSESGLVAIAEVAGNIAEVTRRYARAASMSLEKNIETEHRFVMVPITLSFTLKRLSGSCAAPDTVIELDRFVSINMGETANMLQ